MYGLLAVFVFVVSLSVPTSLLAQTAGEITAPKPDRSFRLKIPRTSRTEGKIDLRKLNEKSLNERFRLSIDPTDRDQLNRLQLSTTDGREIFGRLPVTFRDRTLIMGTTLDGHDILVSFVDELDGRLRVTFSLTDRSGRFVSLTERDEIFLFDRTGRKLCFEIETIETAGVPIHIGMALDVSGSMKRYHAQLNQALKSFAENAPRHAQCTVVQFRHKYRTLAGGVLGEASCRSLRTMELDRPSGETRAFPALREVYRQLHATQDGLKLALVVSDGVSQKGRIEEARSEKRGIPTFVNWLGDYDTNYALREFADAEIFGSEDKEGLMDEFFERVGANVKSQFVATECWR